MPFLFVAMFRFEGLNHAHVLGEMIDGGDRIETVVFGWRFEVET